LNERGGGEAEETRWNMVSGEIGEKRISAG